MSYFINMCVLRQPCLFADHIRGGGVAGIRTLLNRKLFLLTLIFATLASFVTTQATAQDNRWYHGFYIEGSALHYFTPDVLTELIVPKTGFRAGFGYELKNFRFTIESGYTNIDGTNPLVTDISFIPLMFKLGYNLPLFFGFGIQTDIGMGFFFSETTRYESALDLFLDNKTIDEVRSPASAVRLYLTWSPWKFIKFYAGGGADIIFETDNTIPLPLIEAGISIKPLRLIPSGRRKTVNGIYFENNTVFLQEQYKEKLDEAGERLKANPRLKITLRAYHAPARTSQSQVQFGDGTPALSSARAQWCAEYLMQNYGITNRRITIEHRGAGGAIELYNCVEIIIK